MPEPLLLRDRDGDVAVVTFNDPDRRNAMSQAMGAAFAACVTDLAAEEDLRAVVFTGAGKAFSAGGDLGMIEARAAEGRADPELAHPRIRETMRDFYDLFLAVRRIPCPTLAAINGAAIGAGLCLALACDVRIAAATARLGLNFTALGLHPGMGATWTLPRLVGPAHAAELLFGSRILTGAEAADIGLVNRALPAAEVVTAAREMAASFAANGPLAVRGVKRALERSPAATLADQLDFEADVQARCFVSEDVHEGLAAARERRRPHFRGR